MGAVISDCGRYRYRLCRTWNALTDNPRRVLWIMLNPSTADAEQDDPTIRRCIAFSKSWGYDGLMVGNLYAYRATNPKEMFDAWKSFDVIGPDNYRHIAEMAESAQLVIAAWGVHARPASVSIVREGLRNLNNPLAHNLFCLKTGDTGYPRHPLYLPSELTPILWSPNAS